MRVTRSEDSQWSDHDGSGTGTVTGLGNWGLIVEWDAAGSRQCRWGPGGIYGLRIVPDAGRLRLPLCSMLYRTVVRGPDWSWEEQDGRGSGLVVAACGRWGWLLVHWQNGSLGKFRWGFKSLYDVAITLPTGLALALPPLGLRLLLMLLPISAVRHSARESRDDPAARCQESRLELRLDAGRVGERHNRQCSVPLSRRRRLLGEAQDLQVGLQWLFRCPARASGSHLVWRHAAIRSEHGNP
jgi:hypothetical protein